jgi:hypothetical protein
LRTLNFAYALGFQSKASRSVYPPRPGRPGSPAGLGIFEPSDKSTLEVEESLSEKELKELEESEGGGVRELERVEVALLGYGEEERLEYLSIHFESLDSGVGADDDALAVGMILALGPRISSAISVVGRRSALPNTSNWSVSIGGRGGGTPGSESQKGETTVEVLRMIDRERAEQLR